MSPIVLEIFIDPDPLAGHLKINMISSTSGLAFLLLYVTLDIPNIPPDAATVMTCIYAAATSIVKALFPVIV